MSEDRKDDCDSCVTCGDVAVQVRVVGLLPGGMATVDTGIGAGTDATSGAGADAGEVGEEISVALVAARVGDIVLVHAGEAIAVLGREEG
ncbi:HypC/HybG/HupF family hydrogenase formation chaperone [Nonomuraea rosea]|uniref:HypC/HybG/HupF family hydrogenase formation chaperone n=1 Tax=Nonomuraea rosea TaxID=638574 RepID=A0ABP6WHM3_9ACTN